eukprot:TRINITY_DN66916_c0_g1_i1.p1 TRINITY_DN66916_c0_g1~~TRINITY_DN66916_c0_g1_i1.p1  ORF type:complete len:169 (-),score=16.06 TRINITY_DN66916_c0_g1_i1:4-510(-)
MECDCSGSSAKRAFSRCLFNLVEVSTNLVLLIDALVCAEYSYDPFWLMREYGGPAGQYWSVRHSTALGQMFSFWCFAWCIFFAWCARSTHRGTQKLGLWFGFVWGALGTASDVLLLAGSEVGPPLPETAMDFIGKDCPVEFAILVLNLGAHFLDSGRGLELEEPLLSE